jgi:hypothetical protein
MMMIEYFQQTDIKVGYWTWILSREHSCTVFEMPRVQISGMELAILTVVFRASSVHPGSFRVCSLNYPFSLTYYFWFSYELRTVLITCSTISFSNIIAHGLFCSCLSKSFMPCWVSDLTLHRLNYCGDTACTRNGLYENKFCSSSITVNRESSVDIATGYWLDGRGLILGRSNVFFSKAFRPALGPPSLLSNGY